MANPYFLGVDIGTHHSKALIVDFEGKVVASAAAEHGVSSPYPGWAEHDPEEIWWRDFTHLCRAVMCQAQLDPRSVVSVGCSGLGPAMVPIGASGEVLRPAILYGIDTRCTEEATYLGSALGQSLVLKKFGNRVTTQSLGARILWYRKHEPELFHRTWKLLNLPGYLVFRLTGETVVDRLSAGTPLFDRQTGDYDSEALSLVGVDRSMLPAVAEASSIAGEVSDEAADQTGLAPGTPVVVGTCDIAAEALSAGVVTEGKSLIVYGSTMVILSCVSVPGSHPSMACVHHAIPGMHCYVTATATGGALTTWFRDNFDEKAQSAYGNLASAAAAVPVGSEGLICLPSFAGERSPVYDPLARGMFIGLTTRHTRAHMYRAILEGIAFSVRQNMELHESIGSNRILYRVTGGGLKNHLWTQIVSDVADREQHCLRSAGAPVGMAYMAGMGVGAFDGLNDLENKWLRVERVAYPNAEAHRVYDHYYGMYKQIYPANARIMHGLATLASSAGGPYS